MIRKFTMLMLSVGLLTLLGLEAYAQGTVNGRIVDESGEPLIGATVLHLGTTKGVATDFDGNYSLTDLPDGEVRLQYSYTGYAVQDQVLNIRSGQIVTLNITLAEDAAVLDEVVVIGYGSQRKRKLIGTVAKIENEELKDVVGGTFDNALQGRAAGVQVTSSSGLAAAPAFIRIRGVSSISAGGDPLYVVDGIPITQDIFLSGGNRFDQNNNPLSSINPNDIESIEILKDASAAAIYGSRGANGVILITTKRGRAGKPTLTFGTRIGFSNPSNMLEFLNADEFLSVRQEAWENDGNTGRAPLVPVLEENGYTYEEIEDIDTDWMETVLHTGIKQEYNLGMRQGSEKFASYVGLSWSDAETFLVGNRFQRASARANFDYRFSKKGSISLSTSIARGLNDRVRQQFQGGFGTAQSQMLPIYPMFDRDGNYFLPGINPVAQRELTDIKTREWRSINNIAFNYRPVEGLALSLVGNYDFMDLGDFYYVSQEWQEAFNNPLPLAIASEDNSLTHNWSTFGTAQYDFLRDNDKHNVTVLLGLEYQSSQTDGRFQEWQDVGGQIYTDPTRGENFLIINDTEFERDRWKFASVFGRINYEFKGKYLVQGTFRRDGSSKFGRNKRFGNFPSVGVGYILSEEPFLKGSKINFLKLKASWGITGNADIDWREQFATRFFKESGFVSIADYYNTEPVRIEVKPENPDLQWEVTNTYDTGIEFGLLDDRISGEFSYYYKRTTDALILNSIQASIGIGQLRLWENIGEIENKGIEFGLTTRNLVGRFKWRTDFNISRNKNKVLSVGTAQPDALAGGFGDVRVLPGFPLGSNYLNLWSRVDPETGRPIYLDTEGNETFDYDVVNNRTVTGDVYPEVAGGITNVFSYDNFDMNILFTFQIGGTIYDDAAKRQLGVVSDWNMRREVLDRWRQPGDDAAYPQYTMSMLNWG
ncbi:MAG: SusC/RagA family TonB-linked outer membrane protein, partial [Bacteroidota bacterium]